MDFNPYMSKVQIFVFKASESDTQFMQALPVFTFANQAGLDMLETTLVALQDITLEKIFDDHGRKTLCSEFPQIMQQVWIKFSKVWTFSFMFLVVETKIKFAEVELE